MAFDSLRFTSAALVLALAGCSSDPATGTTVDAGPTTTPDAAVNPGTADSGPTTVAPLLLPGDKFYPESMSASSKGDIYVGSLGTGKVVRFAAGATTSTDIVAGAAGQGVAGVLVDDAAQSLWVCTVVDFASSPPKTELRRYDLNGGNAKSFPFSKPAFCNDIALDGAGGVFVADSFGGVWRMAKGATELSAWSTDPLLAPSSPTGFGADGIVYDAAAKTVWVNTFSDGRLVRIPSNADGTAGKAVEITVTPKLEGPDGMRRLDDGSILLVEGNTGKLTRVVPSTSAATATATAVATGLDSPTSLARVGAITWVTEGQLGFFLGAKTGMPKTPFRVVPVTAR